MTTLAATRSPTSSGEPSRSSVADSIGLWTSIWTRPWNEIAELEIVPGCRVDDDEWVIPIDWAAASGRSVKQRRIDFQAANRPDWSQDDVRNVAAKRRTKRIAILLAVSPVKIGRQYLRPNRPTTWLHVVRALISVIGSALVAQSDAGAAPSSCPDDGIRLFAGIDAPSFLLLSKAHRRFAHLAVPRLNALFERGAFDDWPSADVVGYRYDLNPHRPFDDDVTGHIARAALWLVETVGADLLTCWHESKGIDQTPSGARRNKAVNEYRREWLSTWSGRRLKLGGAFEYGLLLPRRMEGKSGWIKEPVTAWPPVSMLAVRTMVSLLQTAHLILLFLATAARDGELINLDYDCLVPLPTGHAVEGKTFKGAEGPSGEERYWPLPSIAVFAVRQQQRLHTMMGGKPGKLWCNLRSGAPERDRSPSGSALRFFSQAVLLPDGRSLDEICEGNVHPHRFRKTVVRLTALSLVGANQVLMDVLGHRDPEMTLGYILSDPQFQADLDQVRQEASIALATEAVKGADMNGGPAARAVNRLARQLLADRATPEQEVEGLRRAAAILSENGQVSLVRKGVLCTKGFQQSGPCTREAGNPDAGNCQIDCVHRLELAAAQADHRASIETILDLIPRSAGLERAFWQGQLLAHLAPFPELRDEMLQRNAVQEALNGVGSPLLQAAES